MNAQRLHRLIRPHDLTSLLIVSFALLVLAFGLGAGAAQPRQEGSADAAPQEREFKNTVRAHVPIKVKIKNEQSFKNLKNKNWARELEIEIKNTGAKPIYYLYVVISMPDVIALGHPVSLRTIYGRKELAFFDTPLVPEDVPILPGESYTLKFPESHIRGYEKWREEEKRADPKKVEFYMQIINYGDGTGFEAMEGLRVPRPPRKRSRNEPPAWRPPGDGQPALKAGAKDSPGKLLEPFYPSTPASLLRVNFSPAGTAPTSAPTIQLPGGCTNCQHSNDCMWGRHGFPDCPCDDTSQFPSVMSVNSCGDASGRCLRVVTKSEPCDTQFNGQQFCQFQEFVGECSEGDPTPTPTPTPDPSQSPTGTPTPTPTPDPNATPTAERPNDTNCLPHTLPIPGAQPSWFCLCEPGDEGTPADYPRNGPTGCPRTPSTTAGTAASA